MRNLFTKDYFGSFLALRAKLVKTTKAKLEKSCQLTEFTTLIDVDIESFD